MWRLIRTTTRMFCFSKKGCLGQSFTSLDCEIVRMFCFYKEIVRVWMFSDLVCFYEKKGHAGKTFTSMDCERCPIVALQLHFFHRKPAFEAESSWLGSFGLNTCGQLNGICFSPWPAWCLISQKSHLVHLCVLTPLSSLLISHLTVAHSGLFMWFSSFLREHPFDYLSSTWLFRLFNHLSFITGHFFLLGNPSSDRFTVTDVYTKHEDWNSHKIQRSVSARSYLFESCWLVWVSLQW